MKNNKWIFTSFVLAFIAIPVMTHLVALIGDAANLLI